MPTNWSKPCAVPSFFLLLTALSGCESAPSEPLPSPDGGKDVIVANDAIVANDVVVSNDAELDTTRSDADATPPSDAKRGDADVTPEDGDAATCMCLTTNGGGNTSLPCVCEQAMCPDYATASTACPTNSHVVLQDFSACGLVAIERRWGQDVTTYVFDATTHQLVGMETSTDTTAFACGGDRVSKLHGGTFPTCAASQTTPLCGDAGPDAAIDGDSATPDASDTGAPDADGSACTCAPSIAGPGAPSTGVTSLPCYCGSFACPTFDAARTNCPPNFGETSFNTLVSKTYASCGLVTLERTFGLDRTVYAFDATTHDLVGAQYQTDVAGYTCGTTQVAGVRAGTFPDPSCVATTVQLCTTGDAGGD
jgi:hypothetical protein